VYEVRIRFNAPRIVSCTSWYTARAHAEIAKPKSLLKSGNSGAVGDGTAKDTESIQKRDRHLCTIRGGTVYSLRESISAGAFTYAVV